MTKCVQAGGLIFNVTDDFDENNADDMRALRELGEYLTSHAPKPTPEQEAKQDASRDRIRTRNARLRLIERPPDG